MLTRLWAWYNRYDAWKLMAWVLTILVIIGAYSFDLVEGLKRFVFAMAVGLMFDFLLHRTHTPGYKQWPLSGGITARIVLLVLPFDVSYGLLALAIVLSLLSKHYIRWQKKHIFNPSAFGVVLVSLFFGLKLGWWGDAVVPLTILLAIPVVWRVRKHLQVLSFLAAYLILLLAMNPATISGDMLGFLPWFFGLVMVAEPMTSVPTRRQQLIFGGAIAILAFALSYLSATADVALPLALLGGNILAAYLRQTKT